jgi:hypothetical protein
MQSPWPTVTGDDRIMAMCVNRRQGFADDAQLANVVVAVIHYHHITGPVHDQTSWVVEASGDVYSVLELFA